MRAFFARATGKNAAPSPAPAPEPNPCRINPPVEFTTTSTCVIRRQYVASPYQCDSELCPYLTCEEDANVWCEECYNVRVKLLAKSMREGKDEKVDEKMDSKVDLARSQFGELGKWEGSHTAKVKEGGEYSCGTGKGGKKK